MARGDSEIAVKLTGDERDLARALSTADRNVGGMVKSLGVGLAALGAVKVGFDFLGDSTQEADRLGDAIARLDLQLGTQLTDSLEATAGGLRKLGLSSQDVLELEAAFADIATAAGIADPLIAATADDVAAVAAATALLTDQDPAAVVEAIGRAAGGAEKSYKILGVAIDETEVAARAMAATGKDNADALTDGELAAARLAVILEQLKPKYDAVTAGAQDLEGAQAQLDATVEELQGKLGGPLSDALVQVLGFINDEIDAIPHAIEGWQMLGKVIEDFGRFALTPLANVHDALQGILGLLRQVNDADVLSGSRFGGDKGVSDAIARERERNGLNRTVGTP